MESQGLQAKGILLEFIVFSDTPLTKYYTFILKDPTYLNFLWSCKYSPEGFKFKSKLDYATLLFTAFQWLLILFKHNATPFPVG